MITVRRADVSYEKSPPTCQNSAIRTMAFEKSWQFSAVWTTNLSKHFLNKEFRFMIGMDGTWINFRPSRFGRYSKRVQSFFIQWLLLLLSFNLSRQGPERLDIPLNSLKWDEESKKFPVGLGESWLWFQDSIFGSRNSTDNLTLWTNASGHEFLLPIERLRLLDRIDVLVKQTFRINSNDNNNLFFWKSNSVGCASSQGVIIIKIEIRFGKSQST